VSVTCKTELTARGLEVFAYAEKTMKRAASRRSDALLEHLRAGGAAVYEETLPPADLREVVACLWLRVVRGADVGVASPIIPDGCGDLMVYDDSPPIVAGPDATTRWVTIGSGTVITGARFRPGGIRAVFGCPATTILNRTVLLSDLTAGATRLHERLLLAGSVRQRQRLLADWIRSALCGRTMLDRRVRAACRWLTNDPCLDISRLADRFDWNVRTVRRDFHAACGYGPKYFQRIMRIQRAIRESHEPSRANLVDVALAAGYADQAHMTRDFHDITGFTPAQHLATTRPELGLWIAEGW
jgi:AraC-like DNA-binding protein